MKESLYRKLIKVLMAMLALFVFFGGQIPVQAELNELQSWNGFIVNGPIYKNVLGDLKIEPRMSLTNNAGKMVLRTGIGYQLNKRFSVWQGYFWIPTVRPRFINENRPFQQVLFVEDSSKFKITLRARIEERFIGHVNGASIRQRLLTRVDLPIGSEKHWGVFASNELFINLNSLENGPQAGFAQDRLYCGLSRKVNEHMNAEIGYMYNPISKSLTSQGVIRHNIVFRFYLHR